jgi:hypothetical protein
MALTRKAPNTIHLGGPKVVVNEYVASAAITPGYLIELHSDSGTLSWRKNASATEQVTIAVALDAPMFNEGIDDDYADGDLVEAAYLQPGSVFYGLIPSGQDIAVGDFLQSNGDGLLKEATATTATANVAKFQSLDAPGSVTAETRLRVVVIQ